MRQLFKGTIVLTMMTLVTQFGSLLLVPIFSHLISPDMYGIIGLLSPFTTFMITTLALGFPTAESRDLAAHKDDPQKMGQYLFSINLFLMFVALTGLILLLVPATRDVIVGTFGISNIETPYIMMAYVTAVFSNMLLMLSTYLNFTQQYLKRAVMSVVAFVLSNVLVLYIILSSGDGVSGKLLGGIAAQLIMLGALSYPYLRLFRPKFDFRFIIPSLQIGIPLTVTGIFMVISDSGNRFIMNQLLPLSLIGQYTIAWTISSPLFILFTSFHVVWMPEFFKNMQDKVSPRLIENRLLTVFTLITAVIMVAQLFVYDAARLILNEQYQLGARMAVGLLPYFLGMTLFSLLSDYIIFFKHTSFTAVIYIGIGLGNLLANYALIPLFGIGASILLMSVTQVIICICLFVYLRLRFQLRFRYWAYAVMLLMVMNPLAVQIGEGSISDVSMLLLKLVYGGTMAAVLIWIMPEKERLFQRALQFFSSYVLRRT